MQRDGWDWACGDEATVALSELVAGRQVRCELLGQDRWGRALAVCFAGDLELNREMVRRGWALAWYPERGAVPGLAYDAEQLEAKQAQHGLWSGTFALSWEWRGDPPMHIMSPHCWRGPKRGRHDFTEWHHVVRPMCPYRRNPRRYSLCPAAEPGAYDRIREDQ